MTAAHRQLLLGTQVMVKNLEPCARAEVKITDRSPHEDNQRRIIDPSTTAAHSLGLVEQGVAPVRVVNTEQAATQQKRPEEALVYVKRVAHGPARPGTFDVVRRPPAEAWALGEFATSIDGDFAESSPEPFALMLGHGAVDRLVTVPASRSLGG